MTKEELKTTKTIIRNIIWRTFSIFTSTFLAIIVSVMTARILGPNKMGQFSFVLWLVNVLLIFMGLGIPAATTKYVAEYFGRDNKEMARSIIRTLFLFELLLAGIIASISMILVFVVVPTHQRIIFILAIGSRIPTALGSIYNAAIQGLQDFKVVSKVGIFNEFLRSILVALFLILGFEIIGIFTAGLIVSFYYLLRITWVYKKYFAEIPSHVGLPKELIIRITKFCLTLSGIMIISSIVWQESEVFFLKYFSTNEQIAFYSLAFGIAARLKVFTKIVAHVLMPSISHMSGNNDYRKINELYSTATRYLALIFIPVFLGAAALIGKLIILLYGTEYREVITPAMIILSFNIFGSVTIVSSALTTGIDRQDIILKIGSVVAVINIITDFIFIPTYGAIGAAVANSIAQSIGAIIGTYIVVNILGFKFPLIKVLLTLLCAVIMALYAYVVNSTYYGWGSFFIALITGVLIYLFMIRLLKVLEEKDREFLSVLGHKLPFGLNVIFSKIVNILVP